MSKTKLTSRLNKTQNNADFEKIINICRKNYLHYPNVIGIGSGLKFVNDKLIDDKLCIHFYVREKTRNSELSGRILPKFVYSRFKDGSIDYSTKVLTDVIALKGLSFSCKAGTVLDVIGESGTLTLIFRNKTFDNSKYFALTCAHVAGDVQHSSPIDPSIQSKCCQNASNFAVTIVNSTHNNQHLLYDIALAQISDSCTPQPELEINESQTKIMRFLPSEDIRVPMTLECAFPVSNIISANLSGHRITLPIEVDGVEYQVENLFQIDRTPSSGDSGGLLYNGQDAVGILVAKADGFGFFQPLEEAFEYLKTIAPFPIKCF